MFVLFLWIDSRSFVSSILCKFLERTDVCPHFDATTLQTLELICHMSPPEPEVFSPFSSDILETSIISCDITSLSPYFKQPCVKMQFPGTEHRTFTVSYTRGNRKSVLSFVSVTSPWQASALGSKLRFLTQIGAATNNQKPSSMWAVYSGFPLTQMDRFLKPKLSMFYFFKQSDHSACGLRIRGFSQLQLKNIF